VLQPDRDVEPRPVFLCKAAEGFSRPCTEVILPRDVCLEPDLSGS